jgi:hypothetical protein
MKDYINRNINRRIIFLKKIENGIEIEFDDIKTKY